MPYQDAAANASRPRRRVGPCGIAEHLPHRDARCIPTRREALRVGGDNGHGHRVVALEAVEGNAVGVARLEELAEATHVLTPVEVGVRDAALGMAAGELV